MKPRPGDRATLSTTMVCSKPSTRWLGGTTVEVIAIKHEAVKVRAYARDNQSCIGEYEEHWIDDRDIIGVLP